MFDCFDREINYLRISVTERCNLRCFYCMPRGTMPRFFDDEILSVAEIFDVVSYGARNGITKIKITGGEPLVRSDILDLIEAISKIDKIKDLGMTTNGVLLQKYAKSLKLAGLHRVNVSLDTTDAQRFRQITRYGNLEKVLSGIEAAQKAGLTPVKLNCVIRESADEPDAVLVAQFAKQNNLQVRFIRQMNLRQGMFWPVQGGEGGNCFKCNRLRLTSGGMIKPCLFSNIGYDIRKIGIQNAYRLAVANKPKNGTANLTNQFYNIGG